jgi:hypothetical protein
MKDSESSSSLDYGKVAPKQLHGEVSVIDSTLLSVLLPVNLVTNTAVLLAFLVAPELSGTRENMSVSGFSSSRTLQDPQAVVWPFHVASCPGIQTRTEKEARARMSDHLFHCSTDDFPVGSLHGSPHLRQCSMHEV